MIKIYKYGEVENNEIFSRMADTVDVSDIVTGIIENVKANGDKALFYVDFVIRAKNGQVFLFDTKTEGSDPEAPNKHNALIDYINSEENKHLQLKGGIIIEKNDNWYYSPFKIDDTTEITGWSAFYPVQYK